MYVTYWKNYQENYDSVHILSLLELVEDAEEDANLLQL